MLWPSRACLACVRTNNTAGLVPEHVHGHQAVATRRHSRALNTRCYVYSYRLQAKVKFSAPGLVIQGAGMDKTTIYLPRSLSDLYGNKYQEGGRCCTSDYSHVGAFIEMTGWDPIHPWNVVATVTRPARRGDTRLFVNGTNRISTGQWLRLVMDGDPASLIADMSGGKQC